MILAYFLFEYRSIYNKYSFCLGKWDEVAPESPCLNQFHVSPDVIPWEDVTCVVTMHFDILQKMHNLNLITRKHQLYKPKFRDTIQNKWFVYMLQKYQFCEINKVAKELFQIIDNLRDIQPNEIHDLVLEPESKKNLL